jgi:TonB family protein
MSETWKLWEGRTVEGKFPLQSCLGASDHSAVYLTVSPGGAGESEKAAIKLIPADLAGAEDRLLRWKATGELTHPNLIRIFATGRCELDGTELLYVVMEYAEENLSQILPERALTAEEAQGLLPPILRTLQWVHNKGYVHGHIQPSNILAIGDQVKVSSDALCLPGERRGARTTEAYDPPEAATGTISTATDVWQLGMTLIEALTQHLPVCDHARPGAPEVPEAVPEPFREIAGRCLRVDAGRRWTVAEILDRLEPNRLGTDRLEAKRPVPTPTRSGAIASAPAIAAQQEAFAKWPYLLLLAAVVVVALFLIARPKSSSPPVEMQSTQTQPGAPAENSQPANSQPGQASTQPQPEVGGGEKASANPAENGVVQRIMPQVSPSARRTIQGKIKVRVKVEVDTAGNVVGAKLESAGPSKYFSRAALDAAREWKFSPARAGESGAREWKLQFAFSRAKTEASAVRTKR